VYSVIEPRCGKGRPSHRFVKRRDGALDLFLAPQEPVRGPDSMEVPAKPHEVLLA
jgi:hypothetical protein